MDTYGGWFTLIWLVTIIALIIVVFASLKFKTERQSRNEYIRYCLYSLAFCIGASFQYGMLGNLFGSVSEGMNIAGILYLSLLIVILWFTWSRLKGYKQLSGIMVYLDMFILGMLLRHISLLVG